MSSYYSGRKSSRKTDEIKLTPKFYISWDEYQVHRIEAQETMREDGVLSHKDDLVTAFEVIGWYSDTDRKINHATLIIHTKDNSYSFNWGELSKNYPVKEDGTYEYDKKASNSWNNNGRKIAEKNIDDSFPDITLEDVYINAGVWKRIIDSRENGCTYDRGNCRTYVDFALRNLFCYQMKWSEKEAYLEKIIKCYNNVILDELPKEIKIKKDEKKDQVFVPQNSTVAPRYSLVLTNNDKFPRRYNDLKENINTKAQDFYEISKLVEPVMNGKVKSFIVAWKGYKGQDTIEPLSQLKEDAPKIVDKYIRDKGPIDWANVRRI